MTEKKVDETAYPELVGKEMEKTFDVDVVITRRLSLTITVSRDEIENDEENWEEIATEKADDAGWCEDWGSNGVQLDNDDIEDVSIESVSEA